MRVRVVLASLCVLALAPLCSAQTVLPGPKEDPVAAELFCFQSLISRLQTCERTFKPDTYPLKICCDAAMSTYQVCRDRILPRPPAAPPAVLPGGNILDANGDGKVNFDDAPVGLAFYANTNPAVAPLWLEAWSIWMRTH